MVPPLYAKFISLTCCATDDASIIRMRSSYCVHVKCAVSQSVLGSATNYIVQEDWACSLAKGCIAAGLSICGNNTGVRAHFAQGCSYDQLNMFCKTIKAMANQTHGECVS